MTIWQFYSIFNKNYVYKFYYPKVEILKIIGGKEMLKLALKPGESLKIGDDVKMTVMLSTYNRIQLMIDAPREINIQREKTEQPKIIVAAGGRKAEGK